MNKMRHIKSHKGFTLIEFSIVMIISGLVLVAGMDLYKIYLKGQKKSGTYETMDKFNNAINSFYSAQKRYPCPADPALPESDPNAGLENCIAATPVGFNSGGIWKVAGRDVDFDSINENVLIGAIPYKTLKIGLEDLVPVTLPVQDDIATCNQIFFAGGVTPSYCTPTGAPMGSALEPRGNIRNTISSIDTLDAWGNRITYAVSEPLTSTAAGSFDVSYGTISVQTETGAQLTEPAGSAMWVLASHGEDGNGAYNAYGNIVAACGTVSADIENCNNDNVFVNGINVTVPGAGYFDDVIYYSVMRLSSLWTNAIEDAATGSKEGKDIINRNIGGVGIGLPLGTFPSEKLEVANKLRASNFMAQQTCNLVGTDCFDHGAFGAGHPTGKVCPPPATPGNVMVVTKIAGGNVQCDEVTIAPTATAQECAPGKAMLGINSDGFIICEP